MPPLPGSPCPTTSSCGRSGPRALEAVAWLGAMAHQYPVRYRAIADERLAALLATR
jgi:hypothetical protein